MSQGNMPDLSGLPAEVREKLEKQLASMSPEMRRHFIENGVPQLLKRLLPKAQAAAAQVQRHAPDLRRAADAVHEITHRRKPHGHYNDTIRPGDRPGAGRWMLYAVFAGFIITLAFR